MNDTKGFTLVELMIAFAIGLLVVTFALVYSVPGIARESMRSAVFDVQSCLKLARTEAITRNDACACVVQSNTRILRVIDTRGTPTPTDDEQLHRFELPSMVIFARPDTGLPITLPTPGGPNDHVALFGQDGTLASSQGEIHLFGGDRFGRVAVLGAGGTRISRWMNNRWVNGS